MIHDAQTFLHPEDYSGRQAAAYRALLPWIARRARRILTVSEFSRQSLAAHGIGHPGKIDVIYNGTATFPWAPEQPKIGFSATGSLIRSEFGLDKMVPNLGDEIELTIETEFVMATPATDAE